MPFGSYTDCTMVLVSLPSLTLTQNNNQSNTTVWLIGHINGCQHDDGAELCKPFQFQELTSESVMYTVDTNLCFPSHINRAKQFPSLSR